MLIGWSPHSGAKAEKGPRAVVDYLCGYSTTKTVGGEALRVLRTPPPELLIGLPKMAVQRLELLTLKHRYSVAVLSFEAGDVPVEAFNAGEGPWRRQVAEALTLFLEVVYVGIPAPARPTPLVTTHTHTGRLEVNVLFPRYVRNGRGQMRSFNPRPPGRRAQRLHDLVGDTLNGRFGWADPRCPSRLQMIAFPNWRLKAERESARNGVTLPPYPGAEIAEEARRLVAAGGIFDREMLLERLQPALEERNAEIVRVNPRSVSFRSGTDADGVRWSLRGHLFSTFFADDNPLYDLGLDECVYNRAMLLRRAPERLDVATTDWASRNAHRYGYEVAQIGFSARRLLAGPNVTLPPKHPDWIRRKRRSFKTSGARGPASFQSFERSDHLSQIARIVVCRFAAVMVALRRHQAHVQLARALADLPLTQFHTLAQRLETLNDRIANFQGRLRRSSDAPDEADRADRPAGGDPRGGRADGAFRDYRRPLVEHPSDRPAAGRDRQVDGAKQRLASLGRAEAGQAIGSDRRPSGSSDLDTQRSWASARPTRGQLIRRFAKIADRHSKPLLDVSFCLIYGREVLRAKIGTKHFISDGENACSEAEWTTRFGPDVSKYGEHATSDAATALETGMGSDDQTVDDDPGIGF